MDFRDYLIRQHQQERMAQQVDALFTKDEDHAAAATQRIEDQAYSDAIESATVYDDVQESLTDVITQVRDLRARIQSGVVPDKDGRELLADLRNQSAKAGRQDHPHQEQARQRAGHSEGPRRQEGGANREVPGAPQVVNHGR
jgi:hypothetical protein